MISTTLTINIYDTHTRSTDDWEVSGCPGFVLPAWLAGMRDDQKVVTRGDVMAGPSDVKTAAMKYMQRIDTMGGWMGMVYCYWYCTCLDG